ncbi:MAG: serine/threonine-protein phosphatase, partial [Bacteroidales bacterium]|nr:serine/threonine-protein phosphatase [Bacteroidales bacterium]
HPFAPSDQLKGYWELNEQLRMHVTLTPELEEIVSLRNRKIEEAITEVRESYNYARHIQETFLPDHLYVRECFPDSFLLFRPRDIVSGDFYFFSHRNDLIFFAVADCTGHGIPGALLSTIGYGILEQAVDELRLNDAREILSHLYSRLHRFLRSGDSTGSVGDDMDIAFCVFDRKKYELTYAGVKIPLWIISGGELAEYQPANQPEGCGENGDCNFECRVIAVKPGDTVYLFSDGYADQFGGKKHKRYSYTRFREKLRVIAGLPLPEQSDILFDEIENWREENDEDQTDDILVTGIRL